MIVIYISDIPIFHGNILKPGPPLQTLALFLQLRIEAPQATIGLFQLGEPRVPWSNNWFWLVVYIYIYG